MNNQDKIKLQQSIEAVLPKLFEAERITEKLLNEVAVSVIKLMHDGYSNFPLLNEIIKPKQGLTRNNRMKVISFFRTLLPSSYNEDTQKFGKKIKGLKRINKMKDLRQEFLDSEMTFWDWCELNFKDEDKPVVDWGQRVKTAIASAMNEEKGGMSEAQVAVIIKESGIGAGALLAVFQNDMNKEEEKVA